MLSRVANTFYWMLRYVERADAGHAAILREGGDVYLRDVLALVREAQRADLIEPGEPTEALTRVSRQRPFDPFFTLAGRWRPSRKEL